MTCSLPGKLIVFEGIDGTGKSSQLARLAEYLRNLELPVRTTREPTNGRYGQQIRKLYTDRGSCNQDEELALFVADRREHVEQVLGPELAAGSIVLCDRYYLSTIAYQGAKGVSQQTVLAANSFAPQPDLALLLQAPPAVGIARITGQRGEALNDFEQADNLARVAAIFDRLNFPYLKRIDATQSADLVHRQIVAAVAPLLASYLKVKS